MEEDETYTYTGDIKMMNVLQTKYAYVKDAGGYDEGTITITGVGLDEPIVKTFNHIVLE